MFRLAVWFLLAAGVYADQITLANGDRLSGAIQWLDNGKLLFNTEMAGPVQVPWSNVSTIVSTQPLYLALKSGQVLAGSLVSRSGALTVENSGQSWNIGKDDIASIRSYGEQLAYQRRVERKAAPRLLDPWTGFLDAGLSAAHGNAETTTVTLGMNAVRTRPRTKLTVNMNALYARNTSSDPATITADLKRGGLRYEMNVNPRRFGFLSFDAESDALQKLEIRAVSGAGFGQHVLKNQRTTFDLFAGSTANREVFSPGVHRLSAEALLSEESTHKVNSILSLRQKLGVFPNLTDTGQYRLTFDSGAVTTLVRWLSWQVSVSDRYISDPVPGTLKNDVLVTTGFRFNLLPPRY